MTVFTTPIHVPYLRQVLGRFALGCLVGAAVLLATDGRIVLSVGIVGLIATAYAAFRRLSPRPSGSGPPGPPRGREVTAGPGRQLSRPRGNAVGIFISYRRDDSRAHAGRLQGDVSRRYSEEHVFRDVEIPPGVDFGEYITSLVDKCNVVLAIIGPGWLDSRNREGERRIDDPDDWVRLEIERALAHDGVELIPVLVDGARLPPREELPESLQALRRRNAFELSDRRWDYDVEQLGTHLDALLRDTSAVHAKTPAPAPPPPAASVGGGGRRPPAKGRRRRKGSERATHPQPPDREIPYWLQVASPLIGMVTGVAGLFIAVLK
jgi:hypothetical protein